MEKNLRRFELGIYTDALTNLTCKPVKENIGNGICKNIFYYFLLFSIPYIYRVT
jgi:hypothetical protein